jgi:hypothetical protein
MGFKTVMIRNLDGSYRKKLKIDKKIAKPTWRLTKEKCLSFEAEIEEYAWEYGVEEEILPFLKEETKDARKGLRNKSVLYSYGCPYCNFKTEFFYCVCLHIAYNEKCYRASQVSPCYPINHCYIVKNGKKYQYIP